MPFIGLGVHVLAALFFAIHAMRTNQHTYWLVILFSFPILGSLAYFLAVYLPETRLERNLRQFGAKAAHKLNPGRELLSAQQAFEVSPNAQNKMRLASALLETGVCDQAATLFEECLQGVFADDNQIRLLAAQAWLQHGTGQRALELLQLIIAQDPSYRAEQVLLAQAQAYALIGEQTQARTCYLNALQRFDTLQVRVEYALWALQQGEVSTAKAVQQEIMQAAQRWNKATYSLNQPLIQRLEKALAKLDN